VALLDRIRSLVRRGPDTSSWVWFSTFEGDPSYSWPWFQSLDGGASWPWFGTFTVAWFLTLDLPAQCRACVHCGDLRPPDQLNRDHCAACAIVPCAICNTPTHRLDLTTYDGRHLCSKDNGARLPISATDREFLLSLALTTPSTLTSSAAADLLTLGDNGHELVTLPLDARNRHVYAIGRTGSGKSSLLRNMVMQDMAAGRGVIFLDPHGDTAQTLLGYVPPERAADVVYFCPTDPTCPSFNLLGCNYAPDKLTRDMVSAIKMFFGESWGPRLNQLLTNALLTLLLDRDNEPHSLADLQRMLTDADYRATVVDRSQSDALKTFWQATFPTMGKDAVNPVLNKLSDLLMPTSPMERLFSRTDNALDLTEVMNGGKILLCNLAKGELGEAGAFLIGGLITTAIAQAALARTAIPEAERRDVFFYVDEFQNFAIDSFESILSEARKYRLNLTVAHQYLSQVPQNLQAAIFGNVAVVICLPISAADATTMRREMTSRALTDRNTGKRWSIEAERREHQTAITAFARTLLRLEPPHTTYREEHFVNPPIDLIFHPPPGHAHPDANHTNVRTHAYAEAGVLTRYRVWSPRPLAPVLVEAVLCLREALTCPACVTGVPHPQYFLGEETDWPEHRDFMNLDALSGFVKIGNAKNTRAFTIRHPKEKPSEETRRVILDRQRAEHEARERPTRAIASAARAPITPPPTNPDDFSF
jgi:hypothetical protein